jgi:hypothetical protein
MWFLVEQALILVAPIGAGNDLLEPRVVCTLPRGAGDQLVALVHISLVVEVVVKLHRLLRHALTGERIMGVRKIGKRESHEVVPPVMCSAEHVLHAPVG